MRKEISNVQPKEGRLLVTSCMETAFRNTLLKKREEGEDEKEDVSNSCKTLRKKKNTDRFTRTG